MHSIKSTCKSSENLLFHYSISRKRKSSGVRTKKIANTLEKSPYLRPDLYEAAAFFVSAMISVFMAAFSTAFFWQAGQIP